ncbi:hypothetical protein BP5796_09267 [Coleophoma crateriformis]|uniref:AB hydrolase-1 domain-containing protein n=1 Tax=Coleophoma crateriformis TaxID=565419 RepID=A0A3D8R3S6_9HELO|nr:hypothetical protein BP5796_09267 [Coleophoma crateriformis]
MEASLGGIKPEFLTIPSKPTAPISYTFVPATANSKKSLVVFVNGLGLPAASWIPSISLLKRHSAILTYDRFGQGLTIARDPLDSREGVETGYGHDYEDVVNDLHEIIMTVAKSKLSMDITALEAGDLRLVLVGASIGGPITRLYAQKFPGTVAGLLILDSNICNVDYSVILPDPNSPDVDPATLTADDCTLEQYIEHRKKLVAMFDLDVKNQEHLDRRTGAKLLPYSEAPKLQGVGGKGPLLSVVGHDPIAFAEQGFQRMGTPRSISMKFMNTYWAKYNQELLNISNCHLDENVVIARGCGHFIQSDNPAFVADILARMLEKLES